MAEFWDLYCEVSGLVRAELIIRASVYYQQPATQSDKQQWQSIRTKFSAAPYHMSLIAVCLTGSQATVLNNRLEPCHVKSLGGRGKPSYIREPFWSDIVTVLETAKICLVRNFSGVIKVGDPPKYCWKETPDIQVAGTNDPVPPGPVEQLGPCRNLQCATVGIISLQTCSRCHKAAYCSKECQKAHWKLVHKKTCRSV